MIFINTVKTPNFATDKNDVPQSPLPVTAGSKRLTLQHFITTSSSLVRKLAPNNQDARPPADWSTWPPPVILDILYGNAVIKRWASQATVDLICVWTEAQYYNQGYAQMKADRTAKREAELHQRVVKRAREEQEIDTLDIILYLHRLSAPQFLLEPTSPPSQPSSPSPEEGSREKVEQWLQSI